MRNTNLTLVKVVSRNAKRMEKLVKVWAEEIEKRKIERNIKQCKIIIVNQTKADITLIHVLGKSRNDVSE